jgi:cyanate permease
MRAATALALFGILFVCEVLTRLFAALMGYQNGGTFPSVTVITIINQQPHPACLVLC